MTKRAKIIYWIFTIWMSLGMVSTAVVQLSGMKEEAKMIQDLGYPLYLMALLGVLKILGVIVVLAPKLLILKEWAYAGFFFSMLGASYSHIVSGDPFSEIFPSLLLLVLTLLSWYLRPPGRKIVSVS